MTIELVGKDIMYLTTCLNPYSNGMTIESLRRAKEDVESDVLILILME